MLKAIKIQIKVGSFSTLNLTLTLLFLANQKLFLTIERNDLLTVLWLRKESLILNSDET